MRVMRLVLVVGSFACTKPNPAATCGSDLECTDPAFAYCDIDGAITGTPRQCVAVQCTPGEFEVCSGNTALVCGIRGDSFDHIACPAGCATPDGCQPFCSPNAVLSCANDVLTSCNAAGTATVDETCALGCASDSQRCLSFEPSNGLGPAFRDAASQNDLVLPAGSRIDTDVGIVQDANGSILPVKSARVTQVGGPSIFALEAKSFVLNDVTVRGAASIAFVATGVIAIKGRVTANARGDIGGPGAQSSSTCNGKDTKQFAGECMGPKTASLGTGGGGNAQVGGRGGAVGVPNGGGALTSFSPLAGGCFGGNQIDPGGVNVVARGGAGGGAVQFVSGTRVDLIEQGLVDVGGGGGAPTTGGGSGGLVVIEAPQVSISGATAGAATNGGAGGGCYAVGMDALPTLAGAPGNTCASFFSGRGGTKTNAAGSGCIIGIDNCVGDVTCPTAYGGGGGSVGRVHVVTKSGTFAMSGNPLLSAAVSGAALLPK